MDKLNGFYFGSPI